MGWGGDQGQSEWISTHHILLPTGIHSQVQLVQSGADLKKLRPQWRSLARLLDTPSWAMLCSGCDRPRSNPAMLGLDQHMLMYAPCFSEWLFFSIDTSVSNAYLQNNALMAKDTTKHYSARVSIWCPSSWVCHKPWEAEQLHCAEEMIGWFCPWLPHTQSGIRNQDWYSHRHIRNSGNGSRDQMHCKEEARKMLLKGPLIFTMQGTHRELPCPLNEGCSWRPHQGFSVRVRFNCLDCSDSPACSKTSPISEQWECGCWKVHEC